MPVSDPEKKAEINSKITRIVHNAKELEESKNYWPQKLRRINVVLVRQLWQ